MGGGSGGSQVIGKQVTEAPEWLQAHQRAIANQGAGLYNQGIGPSYYPGATYNPLNLQSVAGLRQTQNLAQRGNPLMGGILGAANNAITQGGLNQRQLAALAPLQQMSNMQPGRGNADFGRMLDMAAEKTQTAMETGFGGMGRSGAGAALGQVGETIGNIYTQGYGQQYNQDMQNKLAALSQLHGVLGQGQQNAYNWAGMAPQIRDMQFDDPRRLMQVGQAYQQDQQNQTNADIQRWNFNQNRPWNQLQLYNNLVGGLGGGNSTSTTYGQQQNPLWGILGGGLAGAGILGQFLGG